MEVKAKFDHFNVNVTDLNRSIECGTFRKASPWNS